MNVYRVVIILVCALLAAGISFDNYRLCREFYEVEDAAHHETIINICLVVLATLLIEEYFSERSSVEWRRRRIEREEAKT